MGKTGLEQEVKEMYICFREIISIVYSTKINSEWIDELKLQIVTFTTIYSKYAKTITPKVHYLSHYPDLIANIGPPIHYSSMRFERKNLDIKNYALSSRQYKAITYTIARRYCNMFAAKFMFNNVNDDGDADDINNKIRTIKFKINYLDKDMVKFVPQLPFKIDGSVKQTILININSIQIRKDKYYIIHSKPYFAQIMHILVKKVNNKNVFCIIARTYKSTFNKSIYSYRLTVRNMYEVIDANEIIDHNIYTAFWHTDKQIYVPKFLKLE